MRVVLDTNILVSALLVQLGHPAAIYRAWREGGFTLLICAEQLDELKATLHKPAIAARIKPYNAGRLVNELKGLAEIIGALPLVERSPDPTDDFLLALSVADGLQESASARIVPSRDRTMEMRWIDLNRAAYADQWVAVEGDRLVAAGNDPLKVFAAAKEEGIRIPFVVHMLPEDPLPFVPGW